MRSEDHAHMLEGLRKAGWEGESGPALSNPPEGRIWVELSRLMP
jgi:hypothetical protein